MNRFICIDIGGTAIKSGIIQTDGEVLFSQETPTYASEGGKALAARVRDLASDLKERDPQVSGIAISSAGVVNSDNASILHAFDAIPGYKGISFQEELRSLGLPVEAENDVNCAGLSEYESGNAAGADSALILTVGTGIGGCFIREGDLLNGNTYSACEVGYLPLPEGSFQDIAATTALVRMVAEARKEPVSEWNGRRIFELAAEGDAVCQEAIATLCRRLGTGIAAICYILNPEVVILGGGIMAQEAVLKEPIREAFRAASFPLIADSTEIRFASHQNAAGMKGALVHFLKKHPDLAE